MIGGGGGVRGGGKDGEACNFSNCLQKPSCRVGVGWGGVGWVGGSELDNNATLSSAKSLSVRTSVAKIQACIYASISISYLFYMFQMST